MDQDELTKIVESYVNLGQAISEQLPNMDIDPLESNTLKEIRLCKTTIQMTNDSLYFIFDNFQKPGE